MDLHAFSSYVVHPVTAKKLLQKHPWVTMDSYSAKFPKNQAFLHLLDPLSRKFLALAINTPEHSSVKARVWSFQQNSSENFEKLLEKRLKCSFEKREKMNFNRDNFYLVFGENDALPGLNILRLGDFVFIQTYLEFWNIAKIKETLISLIRDILQIPTKNIVFQKRCKNKLENTLESEQDLKPFLIKEFGQQLWINPKRCLDLGIYTDMSATRFQLKKYFAPGMKLINLFCYTGSFSVLAASMGVNIINVDFSKDRLDWSRQNIEVNQLQKSVDCEYIKSCSWQFLENYLTAEDYKQVDFIISDPPSAFTIKNKRINSLEFHLRSMNHYCQILKDKGYLFMVVNTHSLTTTQVMNKVNHPKFKLIKEFKLDLDCQVLNSFPDGQYLKAFLWQKKN